MIKKSPATFALFSIIISIITISLKSLAYFLTGSVGLLSDAVESFVNLFAAFIAFIMLKIAQKPPDKNHLYGHTKAEYFSSIIEGGLIILAAFSISYSAIERLFHPRPLEKISLGLLMTTLASLINLLAGLFLIKKGKEYSSIALKADGEHLLTDVATSFGVIIAVSLVSLTKIQILDPLIALFVALNIILTGYSLIHQSISGLMDSALSKKDQLTINSILKKHCQFPIKYHGLLTRQSGSRKFVSFHLLVPDNWTVKKGHNLIEKIEKEIRQSLPNTHVLSHLEPVNDKKSLDDIKIDRK